MTRTKHLEVLKFFSHNFEVDVKCTNNYPRLCMHLKQLCLFCTCYCLLLRSSSVTHCTRICGYSKPKQCRNVTFVYLNHQWCGPAKLACSGYIIDKNKCGSNHHAHGHTKIIMVCVLLQGLSQIKYFSYWNDSVNLFNEKSIRPMSDLNNLESSRTHRPRYGFSQENGLIHTFLPDRTDLQGSLSYQLLHCSLLSFQ